MKVFYGGRRVGAALAASATFALLSGLLGGCGQPKPDASGVAKASPTTTTDATTTTRPPHKAKDVPVCPLTGAPPTGGAAVPHRAALAVKVENLPQARPQWGLDKADIVFEEPVEGGITRFVAVYQCQDAARIEPVRSGRLVDVQILEPLGKVLYAYAGAIQPVVDQVRAPGSLLEDVGVNEPYSESAYGRDPTRFAPHNLETSTSALYKAAAAAKFAETPPLPIFDYSRRLPAGAKGVSAVHIDYPLDITTWTWDSTTRRWLRSYSDTGLAMQGDNVQISAANVVVMYVHEYPTPYVEDVNGVHENELTLTGSGTAWVFRNGAELGGKWERPSLAGPATFVEDDGVKMTLAPGDTWEELVPVGDRVTTSG
ncbi:MAG: DUF3048 domain-containing protein [Acidimicrobiales bacterium]